MALFFNKDFQKRKNTIAQRIYLAAQNPGAPKYIKKLQKVVNFITGEGGSNTSLALIESLRKELETNGPLLAKGNWTTTINDPSDIIRLLVEEKEYPHLLELGKYQPLTPQHINNIITTHVGGQLDNLLFDMQAGDYVVKTQQQRILDKDGNPLKEGLDEKGKAIQTTEEVRIATVAPQGWEIPGKINGMVLQSIIVDPWGSGGHFVCYFKWDGKWYLANDTQEQITEHVNHGALQNEKTWFLAFDHDPNRAEGDVEVIVSSRYCIPYYCKP